MGAKKNKIPATHPSRGADLPATSTSSLPLTTPIAEAGSVPRADFASVSDDLRKGLAWLQRSLQNASQESMKAAELDADRVMAALDSHKHEEAATEWESSYWQQECRPGSFREPEPDRYMALGARQFVPQAPYHELGEQQGPRAPHVHGPVGEGACGMRRQQWEPAQPQSDAPGEWVNAVLATAPHLNAAGLKEALSILDKALENIKRKKVLDRIVSNTYSVRGMFTEMPHLSAAESMVAQLCDEQQNMLRQLQLLRVTCANGANSSSPSSASTHAVLTRWMQQEQVGQHQQLQQQQQQQQVDANGYPPAPPGSAVTAEMLEQLLRQKQLDQEESTAASDGSRSAHGRSEWCPLAASERLASETALAALEPLKVRKPVAASTTTSHGHKAQQSRGPKQVQNLSISLQKIADEDPERLFIVRRIHKLGSKAEQKLQQHFAWYGAVSQVIVVQRQQDPENQRRWRLSSLGFILMAGAESVQRILSAGPEQQVEGVNIRVQRFDRRSKQDMMTADAKDELEQGVAGGDD